MRIIFKTLPIALTLSAGAVHIKIGWRCFF
jgi:hypothetical protein